MSDQPDFVVGVNQVVTNALLVSQTAPFPLAGTYYTYGGDLSAYQSVTVMLEQNTPACAIYWRWMDSSGTRIIDQGWMVVQGTNQTVAFRLQVKSATLQLATSTAQTNAGTELFFWASNLTVPSNEYFVDAAQSFIVSPAWVAGTPQGLVNINSNGKPIYVNVNVTAAADKGFLQAVFPGAGGVSVVANLTDTGQFYTAANGGIAWEGTIILPPGFVQLQWLPETTAAYTVAGTLITTPS